MEHITINSDRSVTVPVELRKIGVQYDHNVNTIEFVGPRYSSNVDLSTMTIYINYILSDKTPGKYKAENVIIDDQDDSLIRFNWTITRNVTKVSGILSCLVCAKKTDEEGNEINHWNTDIFRLLSVSEGMENDSVIQEQYPDVITSLIQNVEEHDTKLLEFSGLNNRVTDLENNVNEHDAKLLEFSGLDTRVTDIENNVNELKSDLVNLEDVNLSPFHQNIQYFNIEKWGDCGTFWDTSQNPPKWITTGGASWHGYPKLSLKKGKYRMSSDTALDYCCYVKDGVKTKLTSYIFEVDSDFDLYISYTGNVNNAKLFNDTDNIPTNEFGVYDMTIPFAKKHTVYFAIGDSITHANHSGIPTVSDLDPFCPKGGTQGFDGWKSKGYPYYISKKLGLDWYNYGVGGSTITNCKVNGEHKNGFMMPNGRYMQMDNSVTPKYITIFFGWNDGYWGQYQEAENWLKHTYGSNIYYPLTTDLIGTTHADGTPYATQSQYDACNSYKETINGVEYTGLNAFYEKFIGDEDSSDVTKFYGAYNTLIEYLVLKYPYAKIMPIVPYNNYLYNPYIVKITMQNAVRRVCERWGLSCFDFESTDHQLFCGTGGTSKFPSVFKTTSQYLNIRDYRMRFLLADGLHPNTEGYKYMANMIGAKLITI